MLHPSYTDLMEVVNSEVEPGEQPVVQSRYSIVMATSKRARQIIAGDEPLINGNGKKPLSIAVEELYKSQIRILGDEEEELEESQAIVQDKDAENLAGGTSEEVSALDTEQAFKTSEEVTTEASTDETSEA